MIGRVSLLLYFVAELSLVLPVPLAAWLECAVCTESNPSPAGDAVRSAIRSSRAISQVASAIPFGTMSLPTKFPARIHSEPGGGIRAQTAKNLCPNICPNVAPKGKFVAGERLRVHPLSCWTLPPCQRAVRPGARFFRAATSAELLSVSDRSMPFDDSHIAAAWKGRAPPRGQCPDAHRPAPLRAAASAQQLSVSDRSMPFDGSHIAAAWKGRAPPRGSIQMLTHLFRSPKEGRNTHKTS